MRNKRMQEKLDHGDAVDVSNFAQTKEGDYVLNGFFEEGKDYCDATEEAWIWSVGKAYENTGLKMADGSIFVLKKGCYIASRTTKFYGHDEFECVWLR